MPHIYISSTYDDLKDYREAVYHTLRQMGHDVVAMEDYVATDQRPLERCLQDVERCDLYIGLFAWRYGYIPPHDNPAQKSITELEYCQAKTTGKPCLLFLLHEDHPWSPRLMDSKANQGNGGRGIVTLRQELSQETLVSFFTTNTDLARLVSVAVGKELARLQPPSGDRVRIGLEALAELMKIPEVRDTVADCQARFQTAASHSKLLARYKTLHDLLQQIEYQCYNPLRGERARFPQDETASEHIEQYTYRLRGLIGRLEEITRADGGAYQDQVCWIEELVRARDDLYGAVEQNDPERLQRAIWLMNRVLTARLPDLNTRLNQAARDFHLPELIEAMTLVRTQLNRPDLDQNSVDQFKRAVDELDRLNQVLTSAIRDHDRWQKVDVELRQIENSLPQGLSELALSWPYVKEKVEPIYSARPAGWTVTLREEGTLLDEALTAGNQVQIKRHFLRFRWQASDSFIRVDGELQQCCEELHALADPLDQVLEILQ